MKKLDSIGSCNQMEFYAEFGIEKRYNRIYNELNAMYKRIECEIKKNGQEHRNDHDMHIFTTFGIEIEINHTHCKHNNHTFLKFEEEIMITAILWKFDVATFRFTWKLGLFVARHA